MNQPHLDRLDGLAPFLRQPVRDLVALVEQRLHRSLLLVSTWRSVASQWARYAQGRRYDRERGDWVVDDPQALVTRAKPGTSAHNVVTREGRPAALAVDVVPLTATGQPEWDIDDQFWDDLYELAWQVGLDPLGDPLGAYLAWDKGHLEEPAWRRKLEGLDLILPHATSPRPDGV